MSQSTEGPPRSEGERSGGSTGTGLGRGALRRPSGPRLFATRLEEPRARRYSDVAALLLALPGVALLGILSIPPGGLERDLVRMVEALPAGLGGLWRTLIDLFELFAVLLIAAALARRRWTLLRDIVIAIPLAAVSGLVVGRLVQGGWDLYWSTIVDPEAVRGVPWFPLMAAVAVTAVTLPHLSRAMRRLARWLVTLGVAGAILAGAVAPVQAVTSLLLGLGTAAAIHLVFGSVRGRPELDDVQAGLGLLGVDTVGLRVADRRQAGVFVLTGETPDGRPLDVKVYGNDASDTQLLNTVWRRIWFREPGTPTSPGRLQQVEHEAFLTLLAGQAGLAVQPVVTAGITPMEDAVLVLEQAGAAVAPIAGGWTQREAGLLWDVVHLLGEARIAHNQIDDLHLFTDGARLGLLDFSGAKLSSDPWWLRVDHVQALTATVVALGTAPAVELAESRLGRGTLAEILPYLQADTLTPRLRHLLEEAGLDVDVVRDEAARLIEVEAPELIRLRRVTLGSALQAALPVVAFLALASVFTGLDFDDLADAVGGASWWFVAVGVLVAQAPRLTQAVSALGAAPMPVPLGRLYLLQLAQSYIGLTIPGAAARVAMNIRFFQRHGLPSGSALAVGAIDSFFGFFVQILLTGLILVFTTATLDLDLGGETSSGLERLAVTVGVLGALMVVLVVTLPGIGGRVRSWLRRTWSEARAALAGLASPRRLGLLVGGNLGTEVLFAITLGAFTTALGHPIGLGELIFIHVSVSLLAGLLPVPGGIGVFEGGLTFGLVRAGMPEEVAFAAALIFRSATFYLPPLWGMVAFRWLERNKHL